MALLFDDSTSCVIDVLLNINSLVRDPRVAESGNSDTILRISTFDTSP